MDTKRRSSVEVSVGSTVSDTNQVNPPRVLSDWLEFNSFHGIIDFIRPGYGYAWKLAWLVTILAFIGISIDNLVDMFDEFIGNATVLQYVVQQVPLLALPDVVVCSPAKFDPDRLLSLGASTELIAEISPGFGYTQTFNWMQPVEYTKYRQKYPNITFDYLLRNAGFGCEDMVHQCSSNMMCCQNASKSYDLTYGQCFRLLVNQQQFWPGYGSGIEILLKNPMQKCQDAYTQGSLVEFVYPGQPISYRLNRIPPGMLVAVMLEEQQTSLLNLQRRALTCAPPIDDTSDILKRMLSTTNGCFYSYWAKAQLAFCNCTEVPDIGLPLCELGDSCLFGQMDNYTKMARSLQQQCLPQCNSVEYRVTFSYAPLNLQLYRQRLRIDDMDLASLSLLDIFHPTMTRTAIVEVETYTLTTLISNLGGALGLWLGASLMTFIQMLFYACKWCVLTCNARRHRVERIDDARIFQTSSHNLYR